MNRLGNYYFVILFMSLFFMGSLKQLSAQQQISAGIGLGSVRGDLIEDFFSPTGLGPSLQASYLKSTGNGRVWIGGTVSFLYNQQGRDFSSNIMETQFRMTHTFLGFTTKAYLVGGNTTERSKGYFLPYVLLSAGAELYSTSLIQGTPPTSYTVSEGFGVSPGIDGGLGFELSMSKYLSLNTNASIRAGFNDLWDGVQGTGGDSDAIINLNLGLTYVIKGKEIF
jgi:hypothetical protein